MYTEVHQFEPLLPADARMEPLLAKAHDLSRLATTLAGTDTFLRDAAGNQLMLKRPADNQQLMIRSNDTMEGKLVFLGSVPADAKEITLVVNQGNQPDDITGPGMTIKLPLSGT